MRFRTETQCSHRNLVLSLAFCIEESTRKPVICSRKNSELANLAPVAWAGSDVAAHAVAAARYPAAT